MIKVGNTGMNAHQAILEKVKAARELQPEGLALVAFSYTVHVDVPGSVFETSSDEMITSDIIAAIRKHYFKEPTTGS